MRNSSSRYSRSGRLCRAIGALAAVALLLLATSRPNGSFAQGLVLSGARFDLTHNNIVNDADAWTVIFDWMALQQDGRCLMAGLTDRDINADGCLGVADVQTLLSHWGELADPTRARPEPGAVSTAAAATFTVNSAGDESDSNPGDGVCRTAGAICTLRAAIEEATARPGPETITFDIRNANGSCPSLVTIIPGSTLRIDDAYRNGITIDGYTQCGAAPNTLRVGGNAQIKIEIKGSGASNVDGIKIYTPNNVIRGLAIYNWEHQISFSSVGSNNRIEGNFLGTNAANTFEADYGESNTARQGILIGWGPSDNIIGGSTPQARNIISGNGGYGVALWANVYRNRIIGNYLGLKQDGTTGLRNYLKGIDMNNGAQYNWIGGPNPGEGNVISGNYTGGMEVSHGTDTKYNSIVGNYFGVNAFGTQAVPNGENGFSFEDTVNNNYAYNNVVGGNGANGIMFYVLANYNQVYNNKIGVAPDGVTPMPNGTRANSYEYHNGIYVMGGSSHNIIRGNIIANNPDNGIALSNASDTDHNGFGTTFYNTISRNSIYNNGPTQSGSNSVGWGILMMDKTDPSTGKRTFPNAGLPPPSISSATTAIVAGTARTSAGGSCTSCTIEVFIADATSLSAATPSGLYGEGKTFIGAGTTNASGNFAVAVRNVTTNRLVTVTATDTQGNTSSFSRNAAVTPAPAPPVYRVWMPLMRRQ